MLTEIEQRKRNAKTILRGRGKKGLEQHHPELTDETFAGPDEGEDKKHQHQLQQEDLYLPYEKEEEEKEKDAANENKTNKKRAHRNDKNAERVIKCKDGSTYGVTNDNYCDCIFGYGHHLPTKNKLPNFQSGKNCSSALRRYSVPTRRVHQVSRLARRLPNQ